MKIKAVDLIELANRPGRKRIVLMNGPKFHTWLHAYPNPGDRDEKHCHNADQTFYCIEGQCTLYLEDDTPLVLNPGMIALIPGGSFYWLENTGEGQMVLLGSRALSVEASLKIDYETREDINKGKDKGPIPKGTKILI